MCSDATVSQRNCIVDVIRLGRIVFQSVFITLIIFIQHI